MCEWVLKYCFLENQPNYVGIKLVNRPTYITYWETSQIKPKALAKDKKSEAMLFDQILT